jgi:hypothetical protein
MGLVGILWVVLVCHLLIYVPPYMVAPGDLEHLMTYSLSRVLLHAAPAAAVIVGLQLSNANSNSGKLN